MEVKFVSVTQTEIKGQDGKVLTPEELLVYIARVSNPSNQLNTETADKLLGYLIKNKHWSPFDMVNLTVEVTTSKAIAIQILRHWSIKPQEFSQRYSEVTDIEPISLRRAAEKNRQSSEEEFDPEIEVPIHVNSRGKDMYMKGKASSIISWHAKISKDLYKTLLVAGVAKECARMILPMATSTTLYLNGSVRSWIHYLEQRLDQHAQLEHREVAKKILEIFRGIFPNIVKALGYDNSCE